MTLRCLLNPWRFSGNGGKDFNYVVGVRTFWIYITPTVLVTFRYYPLPYIAFSYILTSKQCGVFLWFLLVVKLMKALSVMKKKYKLIMEWIVFIKVVDNKSFSKTAKDLSISISYVSKCISMLEHVFDSQLIRRNAHDFEITTAGKVFYKRALEIYNSYYSLTVEMSNANGYFNGVIRLSAPSILCDSLINTWVWDYMQKHPGVCILLNSRESGTFTRTSPEFDDLVIKSGFIDSPDLIHKRLNPVRFGIYSSPNYLKQSTSLVNPEDINDHSVLKLEHPSLILPMHLFKNGSYLELNNCEKISFRSNNVNSILDLAVQGKGIAIALPEWMTKKYIEKNELTKVLTGWELSPLPCNLVWRYRHHYSLLFKDFMKYMEEKWNNYFF